MSSVAPALVSFNSGRKLMTGRILSGFWHQGYHYLVAHVEDNGLYLLESKDGVNYEPY